MSSKPTISTSSGAPRNAPTVIQMFAAIIAVGRGFLMKRRAAARSAADGEASAVMRGPGVSPRSVIARRKAFNRSRNVLMY